MKELLIVTAEYPFGKGEIFIQTELEYYHSLEDVNVSLVPLLKSETIRDYPENINIIPDVAKSMCHSLMSRIYFLMKSLRHKLFYQELFSHVRSLKTFGLAMSRYEMFYSAFNRYFQGKDTNEMVIYTYWNTEASYALESLKQKYHYRLITRIHGGDVYANRYVKSYLPLKVFFLKNVDRVFGVSENALYYLQKHYGLDGQRMSLSRLGVKDNKIITRPSDKNTFHIVSCSSLKEVKQVDKIIDALEVLAKRHNDIQWRWSHLGEGLLLEACRQRVVKGLGGFSHVKVTFMGNLENEKVFEFYRDNAIDVFVNVSQSEGAPVSIMEAMSCHLPIIAPDVGGISEMIQDGLNGTLLEDSFSNEALVEALRKIEFYKQENTRNASYSVFLKRYNADVNYPRFLEEIVSI